MASLYTIKSIIVLDSEGSRIAAKYYTHVRDPIQVVDEVLSMPMVRRSPPTLLCCYFLAIGLPNAQRAASL
jgi:hypothetical protein